jgi:hypothetical protein
MAARQAGSVKGIFGSRHGDDDTTQIPDAALGGAARGLGINCRRGKVCRSGSCRERTILRNYNVNQ